MKGNFHLVKKEFLIGERLEINARKGYFFVPFVERRIINYRKNIIR